MPLLIFVKSAPFSFPLYHIKQRVEQRNEFPPDKNRSASFLRNFFSNISNPVILSVANSCSLLYGRELIRRHAFLSPFSVLMDLLLRNDRCFFSLSAAFSIESVFAVGNELSIRNGGANAASEHHRPTVSFRCTAEE